MTVNVKGMSRFAVSHYKSGSSISKFFYGTDDVAAVVIAAGYFNDARAMLTPGDQIDASVAIGGTPERLMLQVDTVPVTGNVTVSAETGAVGA